jgi:hypothetical protein
MDLAHPDQNPGRRPQPEIGQIELAQTALELDAADRQAQRFYAQPPQLRGADRLQSRQGHNKISILTLFQSLAPPDGIGNAKWKT